MNGILMRPELHQAIRDLKKTQTRQLIKELNQESDKWKLDVILDDGTTCFLPKHSNDPVNVVFTKPRYSVGDVVYIKEAHYRYGHWKEIGVTKTQRIKLEFEPMIPYENGIYFLDEPCLDRLLIKRGMGNGVGWYLRSPLFLPEDLARDFIKILSVTAQRLQEITFEDCLAEGIVGSSVWGMDCPQDALDRFQHWYDTEGCKIPMDDYVDAGWVAYTRSCYASLWDSINPKQKWDTNPWCWVVKFCLINYPRKMLNTSSLTLNYHIGDRPKA